MLQGRTVVETSTGNERRANAGHTKKWREKIKTT